MARITEVSATSSSPAPRKLQKGRSVRKQSSKEAPPLISYLIFILPLLSIAIGVWAHYSAIRASPMNDFATLSKLPPQALRVQLSLSPRFGQRFDTLPQPFNKLLYILALLFRDLVSHNVGKGVFVIIISTAMPPFAAMLLDSLRPDSPANFGSWFPITIAMLGQLFMIGFAVPALYIPAFAWISWRQATLNPQTIRPLPSPPRSQIKLTVGVLLVSMLTVAWCILAPQDGQHFFWASTAFQFFPLLWLPLIVLKPTKRPAHPTQPLLDGATTFLSLSALSTILYWYGLYLSAPGLYHMMRTGSDWPDEITRLIFIDTVALSAGWYFMVLIQAEVDVRALQCGGPRVHRARLLLEDTIFGTGGLVLGGPGTAMGLYLARRETLAEKARWGHPDASTLAKPGVKDQ